MPYFGHLISSKGLKPDPEKVSAIINMEPPHNINELQTVLGMINYLTGFSPNLAEITAPMRSLLKQDSEFLWDSPQDEAFNKVKQIITQTPADLAG